MVTSAAKTSAVAVCLGLMATVGWVSPSWAADHAFATITGSSQGLIQGDSQAPYAKGAIEVFSTAFSLQNPTSSVGTGVVIGKPVVGPLTMVKRFDRATARLLQAAFTGETLSVEINWYMETTGQKTVSIKLAGVLIAGIDAAAQLDGTQAAGFETVSLYYSKITFISPIYNKDGSLAGPPSQVCFDVALGKAC